MRIRLNIVFLMTASLLSILQVPIDDARCDAFKGRYVQPTVLGPLIDGIALDVPEELKGNELAHLGFVDVTQPPFSADPTGKKDSTKAIQMAVNFARDHQMVCFFPTGAYRISNTISCIQKLYKRSSGSINAAQNHPCVLIGSRNGKRPQIFLSPNSPGFHNPGQPKYVIHFWAMHRKKKWAPQPSISFNQMFINIDIKIENGNPGAVAIRHRGAQGSGIQECTINVNNGLSGIEGGIGSGGSIADVAIIGGRIGLNLSETQPAPTITGVTLIGQTERAILYSGRQALSAVGIKIVSGAKGPVIQGKIRKRPNYGDICLVDSEIILKRKGATAISSNSSIYLKNVYIKGARKAVDNPDGTAMAGNAAGWLNIIEYAQVAKRPIWKSYRYQSPIYNNGNRLSSGFILQKRIASPPSDLQSRHLWGSNFPGWESGSTANVKNPPYFAKGDGWTDDTACLQRAIDENETVFLPKGYYNITKPLILKKNTKLVGTAKHLSIIMTRQKKGSQFVAPFAPKPLLQTANEADADTIIAFCSLYTPRIINGAYALDWSCGGKSILRDVNFSNRPPIHGYGKAKTALARNGPLVLIKDNGGGKWYNFFQEDHEQHTPGYRHLLINNTSGPLSIYQCNPEHSHSDANMEIRSSSNIDVYGLKGEGNKPVLRIKDSGNINVFGYGGNAAAHEGKSLFVIEGSSNIRLVQLVDSARLPGSGRESVIFGKGVDPARWHMVIDKPSVQRSYKTKALDRPVLYKTTSK